MLCRGSPQTNSVHSPHSSSEVLLTSKAWFYLNIEGKASLCKQRVLEDSLVVGMHEGFLPSPTMSSEQQSPGPAGLGVPWASPTSLTHKEPCSTYPLLGSQTCGTLRLVLPSHLPCNTAGRWNWDMSHAGTLALARREARKQQAWNVWIL